MTVKEYREALNMTQTELAEEMSKDIPSMSRPIISLIENGVVEPTQEVIEWLEKVCIQRFNARKSESNIIRQSDPKNALIGDLEHRVYNRLESLKDGERVTRSELCRLCNTSDRIVRRTIEDMRAKGIRIASGGGMAGYFLAKTESEYKHFEVEYLSRAFTALKTASAMRSNINGQMEIA
jgi:transcriptional regulator with XRE-family HTH domain